MERCIDVKSIPALQSINANIAVDNDFSDNITEYDDGNNEYDFNDEKVKHTTFATDLIEQAIGNELNILMKPNRMQRITMNVKNDFNQQLILENRHLICKEVGWEIIYANRETIE